MTMNQSWGYQATDDDWKTPKTIVRNLVTCARDGGNYLLNIGPRGDGSIPEESVEILSAVGRWTEGNGESIYKAQPSKVKRSAYANFTRNGNTLYMHIYFWPGDEARISGLRTKVTSAKFLRTGEPVHVEQDEFATRLTGLPKTAPDAPVTTIALACESEPVQDTDWVRKNRQRGHA
jgi:alpha-L-fucosidase